MTIVIVRADMRRFEIQIQRKTTKVVDHTHYIPNTGGQVVFCHLSVSVSRYKLNLGHI